MRTQTQIISNLIRESYKYNHTSGPKYRFSDDLMEDIVTKLEPMLRRYGLDIATYPVVEKPGYAIYSAYDKDDNRILLKFSPEHVSKDKYRVSKNDIFVEITYLKKRVEAGVIELGNKEQVDQAFNLITMTLEQIKESKQPKEEEPSEETDEELDRLIAFRNNK